VLGEREARVIDWFPGCAEESCGEAGCSKEHLGGSESHI
jgi:hypothetical protein